MKYFVKAILAVLMMIAVLEISACGKMSAPVAVEGSGYPHQYPKN